MSIEIKSYNQMLGNMIRKIVAESALNDINTGSVILSILEACAQNDFDNNVAILSLLELLNLNTLKNADLDTRAADFGLERINAVRASGFVTIGDSSITKRSTSLFQIKPAPIAGTTTLYVNNAADWDATGELYVGSGTANFEGPITYNSITDNVTYYTIELNSALEKDHLISESVVDAQGTTDRLIPAGTEINIPANNQSPAISYNTLRDAVIIAGNDHVDNVEILAVKSGTSGNAGINTITKFTSLPFATATVSNSVPLTNGKDLETDFELRERIKSYSSTLARGTSAAILAAIVGISDNYDNKQVASAVITEPVTAGDPSIIYIDDGSGFEPSYSGQSVDTLLANASGREEYLQLANYPLPRPQIVNTADGPYQLTNGMTIRVRVDDEEETIYFSSSDFANISAATLPEIVTTINDSSTYFKARLTSNSTRLLFYPVDHNTEIIQVVAMETTDNIDYYANAVLKFPTNEFSYIKLYKDNVLLKEKERTAILNTTIFSSWGINGNSNIIISVDGTPPQDRTFTLTDFGVSSWSSLTLNDWVEAFNSKFAGCTAIALSSNVMRISSNRVGNNSTLDILGGSLTNIWFADLDINAVGQNSDFELNRQNGNIKILTDIEEGNTISAGLSDAKGALISLPTVTGSYNVSTDANGTPATLVMVADADEVIIRSTGLAPVGSTLTITDEGSGVMRILSSVVSTFHNVHVTTNDYIYIAPRTDTWLSLNNTGLFKVVAKGDHTSAGVDTWIEVINSNITVEGPISIIRAEDMQGFYSDGYPQVWLGSMATTPASETIENLVTSINERTENIVASIYKTNKVKITSTTEEGGSIAIPVSLGNGTLLFSTGNASEDGNAPHTANRKNSTELVSWFRRTTPSNTNVWFDRFTYTNIRGALDVNAEIGTEGIDSYAEILEDTGVLIDANVDYDDIVSFTKGTNKGHWKAIKQILSGDRVGTRYSQPSTEMNHIAGDEYQVLESLKFSNQDSVVAILDGDSVNKTIDINLSRTGRVNSGSQSLIFNPSNYAFSADDSDNESGVDFGTVQVWSKELRGTEFADYKIWFRAHNWYSTNGVSGTDGQMLLRAAQYGPVGEKIIFSMEYPTIPNQTARCIQANSPDSTTYKYYFGSDAERITGITAATTFSVSDLGNNVFRYTFTDAGTLADNGVVAGDIFSALSDSGVSSSNRGQLLIKNVSNTYIDIYNPDGAATGIGAAEVTQITTVADNAGTQRVDQIDVTGETGATLDIGSYYLKLYDANGSVAFWMNVDGDKNEPAHGCSRAVEINTIVNTSTASEVKNYLITAINSDPEFSASDAGVNLINVVHEAYEVSTVGSAGTMPNATVYEQTAGVDPSSLDGKYFILQDENGSVAFWIDVDNSGTNEPLHGADRSVAVTNITTGMSANDIANAIRTTINNDSQFSAPIPGANEVVVTDANTGGRPSSSSGTSGFTITTSINGSNSSNEAVSVPTSIKIYPLSGTIVSEIVTIINAENLLEVVAIGDDTREISIATKDEIVNPISYGHETNPVSGNHDHIHLYDAENWILNFSNDNPNFTLKKPLLLPGIAPTIYTMDTAPNYNDAAVGEYFKLMPTTINNIEHQLTHKALSQLPIVSNISITDKAKKIQITSNELGSAGSVEIVGGRANSAAFDLINDSEEIISGANTYLAAKIKSYPDTINPGDTIKISNSAGALRRNRLSSDDSISVISASGTNYDYVYDTKNTFFTPYVKIAITDVSALHNRSAGSVFRWTHNDAGSYAVVNALNNGAPITYAATNYNAASSGAAVNLEVISDHAGDISNPQQFNLTLSDQPTQADYFLIDGPSAGQLFGIWFNITDDGSPGTAPSANTPYSSTDYQVQVDILSTDNVNEIVAKVVNVLSLNSNFTSVWSVTQTSGAILDDVNAGDLLYVYGTLSGWNAGNFSAYIGSNNNVGFPIVAVDATNKYFDIVNPYGATMSSAIIGPNRTVQICPTPIIEWNLPHAAKNAIASISDYLNVATVITVKPHHLVTGDSVTMEDIGNAPTPTGTITVTGAKTFTYTTTTNEDPAVTYNTGTVIKSSLSETFYKIEKLGFKDLMRLSWVSGEQPLFIDMGVAIDDIITISGFTFNPNNNGSFRVRAVDNTSIIYENSTGVEQVNTDNTPFNNLGAPVLFTQNSSLITGTAGSFKNLSIGDSIKKIEDSGDYWVQILSFDTGDPLTAETVVLSSVYSGTTGYSTGVKFDQITDVNAGTKLQSISDIRIIEGDSVRIDDSLYVSNAVNSNWFSVGNVGTFTITDVGTTSDYKPYIRVNNLNGVVESSKLMSIDTSGFLITESTDNAYSSYRKVEHIVIDSYDDSRRIVYMTPSDHAYKFSQSNSTQISAMGKMGYSTEVVSGVDGYLYYTGLLRTVQRIIDGYEPDAETYPGRKAIGGAIEILPPLIRRIGISIDITTDEGVNLGEISKEIKTIIINYVNNLGVGRDVILSEIVAAIMNVRGVAACTFNSPTPSTERISINDIEKAFIETSDISIA